MKKFNLKILSVFLAIAIVVSGAAVVAPLGEEVNALSPNYDGSDVYYFCDLYPTLTYETFYNTFSASIFYDVRWVDQDQFREYIVYDYFYGLSNQVVIFDIKTFIPYTDVLYELFLRLKENNCVTGFVTSYSESDFPDTYFLDCVDIFVENAPSDKMDVYFSAAFEDLDTNRELSDTVYLLDGSVLNINFIINRDFEALCTTSYYLNKLIYDLLYFVSSIEYEICDYQNALDEWNINILVYVGNNQFVDLTTWERYTFYSSQEILEEYEKEYICSFGFDMFEEEFYWFLYNNGVDLNYLFEVTPLSYDCNGLDLRLNNFDYTDEAELYLVEALKDWLSVI